MGFRNSDIFLLCGTKNYIQRHDDQYSLLVEETWGRGAETLLPIHSQKPEEQEEINFQNFVEATVMA